MEDIRNEQDRGNFELEDFWTYKISILAKIVDRRSIRALSTEYGLKLSEWRILAQLAKESPLTVRVLAQRMHMDRAEVSRSSAAMERRGLIQRRADSADRRSVLFSTTAKGMRLYNSVIPTRHRENARIAALMSPEERAVISDVLARLIGGLADDSSS